MAERQQRRAIVALFVLSGVAGLIYEVVWARQLVLVFGNTTQAVSAILTGFFGGMAVGAYVGGRLADRMQSPLRLYGVAEISLGIVALATPLLFTLVRELFGLAYPVLTSQPMLLALVRFGLAVLAVAPATILMGATLPSLIRHMTRSTNDLGGQFGRLYAANTLGAFLGAILAGYVLIELVGLEATVSIGAAISCTAGLGGLLISRRLAAVHPTRPTPAHAPHARQTRRALVLTVGFVSGLTSLGYQVLWTRLMSNATANTSYVFTTMLAMFLSGIALGAFVHGRILSPRLGVLQTLAASQLLVGGIAFLGLPLMGDSGTIVNAWLLVILPATAIMGFALPVAAGLLADDESRLGSDSGLLLSTNTIGTVVGTFIVPFFLIRAFGSGWSVLFLATTNLLLGSVLFLAAAGSQPRLRIGAGTGLALAAAVIALPLINPSITESPTARRVERDGILFASAEDEIATVQAGILEGSEHLWVAGVGMTTLTVDTKFMPLIPLSVDPDATSALIVAFGMGSSHRTALAAGLHVDTVELVPSVVDMFGYYYPDADSVLANPHGQVHIADGRNYVALTRSRFDIIMADPPPPIRSAGTGVLYAREFYEACRARLTQGGVMMQWMPHDQPLDDFRAQMRTFQSVFPHITYILSPAGYGIYMLGSDIPIHVSGAALKTVLKRPGVLADIDSTPDASVSTAADWATTIEGGLWLSDQEARTFAGSGPMITDDRPYTEYFLLRSVFGHPSPATSPDVLRSAAQQSKLTGRN